jgi:hypothetical protein
MVIASADAVEKIAGWDLQRASLTIVSSLGSRPARSSGRASGEIGMLRAWLVYEERRWCNRMG